MRFGSLNAALKLAGINPAREALSDKELITRIQNLAKKLDRTPKRREFPHQQVAASRWGSWNNALKAAGLTPLKEFGQTVGDYRNIILEWVKKNGRTPREEDFNNDPYLPDVRTMERKWGKPWLEIMRELGLKPNLRLSNPDQYTDAELLEMLKKEYIRSRPSGLREFNKKRGEGVPSSSYFADRFHKTFTEVLKKAGVPKELINEWKEFTKDDLISILRKIYKKRKKPVSATDPLLKEHDITESTFKKHFGSWNAACIAAGIPINKTPDNVKETDAELLKMYIDFSIEIGKPHKGASSKELDESDLIYNADVFVVRFGGMAALKEAAGFPPIRFPRKYTVTQLKEMLLREYRRLGRRPTNREINENPNLPWLSTFFRYFKCTGMTQIWKIVLE